MADGSLPEAAFRYCLAQDHLFLIEFARACALSVYKSPKLADMREAAAGLSALLDVEMNLHVKLCAGWGLSPSDLEQTSPAVEMLAHATCSTQECAAIWWHSRVALAPCGTMADAVASRPRRMHARQYRFRQYLSRGQCPRPLGRGPGSRVWLTPLGHLPPVGGEGSYRPQGPEGFLRGFLQAG
ncbi:hypothetical protein JJE66_14955 [Bradyrhizobium diazoefficiens]|nr:hypothetical protein [Bradyrhizobium diazoefficiens]